MVRWKSRVRVRKGPAAEVVDRLLESALEHAARVVVAEQAGEPVTADYHRARVRDYRQQAARELLAFAELVP